MMKRIMLLCVTFLMALTILNQTAFAETMILVYDGQEHEYTGKAYKLMLDGEEIETPMQPIIFNDRAVVPVREVFEKLGAQVYYDNKNKKITISGEHIWIIMKINSNVVEVGQGLDTFPDNVTPKLIAKKGDEYFKTMVPLRFIAETLGFDVDYTGDAMNIITKQKPTPTPARPTPNVSPSPTPTETPTQSPSLSPSVSPTPIPTPVLKDVYCKSVGDVAVISVKADNEIKEYTKPILTSAGVLYFDIQDVKSSLPNEMEVNRGAVYKVRTGIHDKAIRIAIDTKELKKYSVTESKDKKSIIVTLVKKPKDVEEQEKIVVIDAGHGGKDGGAVRELLDEETQETTTIKEKDINLSVAKKVVELLEADGVKVEMTRTGDTYPELTERASFANALNSAIFVSIHSNSALSQAANGIEVYYSKQNNDNDYMVTSKELAEEILKEMIKLTNANNRKVKTEDHVVTRKSIMPAVLVELGFMTNDEEIKNLMDEEYQDKLAEGIYKGIMTCLPDIIIPTGEDFVFDESDPGDKIS